MKKNIKWLAGLAIIGGLCSVLVLGHNTSEKDAEDILWREYTVEKGDITASFDGDGVLEWEGEEYSFENPGCEVPLKVKEVFVEEGQLVENGTALVSLDEEKIEETIQKVEEELVQAKRELEEAKENYENAK